MLTLYNNIIYFEAAYCNFIESTFFLDSQNQIELIFS